MYQEHPQDQTLYVGKTTTLAGAVSLSDTLDVEKATTFDSTLFVGKSDYC